MSILTELSIAFTYAYTFLCYTVTTTINDLDKGYYEIIQHHVSHVFKKFTWWRCLLVEKCILRTIMTSDKDEVVYYTFIGFKLLKPSDIPM